MLPHQSEQNLAHLENNVELIVNIVFVLCYAQVREHFNLAAYDEAMQAEYEMFPELKTETEIFKAARWFGGLMDGPALEAMTNAFLEALLNFCPNGSRRAALKKIGAKSKELEQIRCEAALQQIDEAMEQAVPMMQAEMRKQMQESISSVLSGSVPESPESTPPRSPSES